MPRRSAPVYPPIDMNRMLMSASRCSSTCTLRAEFCTAEVTAEGEAQWSGTVLRATHNGADVVIPIPSTDDTVDVWDGVRQACVQKIRDQHRDAALASDWTVF